MKSVPLFIYTETSLHAGVGSTVSAIDLPIQRERTTQFPIVQGSGIKGALRSQATANDDDLEAVFGADTKKEDKFAGAVSVGDARIVLFPVRSLNGVFAYTTCPAVLARVRRDVPSFPAFNAVVTGENALVTSSSAVAVGGRAVLEEFSFTCTADKSVDAIAKWLADNAFPKAPEYEYWRTKVQNSLIVLSDESFRDFVQNSTEIVTRVRLERDTKTVAQGALWTQEALPSDCLLLSAIFARSTRNGSNGTADQVATWLRESIPSRIQLGGDETTGSGMVALRWAGA
ncbi:MAG: type III-B CRISPR module RAMP protein Cmr4 [Anaerolineae bacterium]|nr:type III-B CRISPR module RAMP protein Cmr4 [Anaerolineae bacterium]MDW8300452.1 type III-B CRISPR module RAMP protein Cmr4 [Anaerolineae bacterium]